MFFESVFDALHFPAHIWKHINAMWEVYEYVNYFQEPKSRRKYNLIRLTPSYGAAEKMIEIYLTYLSS